MDVFKSSLRIYLSDLTCKADMQTLRTDHDVSFTKVALPYGWLSNMSPHPILYYGDLYPTAEHPDIVVRYFAVGVVAATSSDSSTPQHATPDFRR